MRGWYSLPFFFFLFLSLGEVRAVSCVDWTSPVVTSAAAGVVEKLVFAVFGWRTTQNLESASRARNHYVLQVYLVGYSGMRRICGEKKVFNI